MGFWDWFRSLFGGRVRSGVATFVIAVSSLVPAAMWPERFDFGGGD